MLQPWTHQLLATAMSPPLGALDRHAPQQGAAAHQQSQEDSIFAHLAGDHVQDSIRSRQVQLLGALAALPLSCTGLSRQQQEAVLQLLMGLFDQQAQGGLASVEACREAAASALQCMAGESPTLLFPGC